MTHNGKYINMTQKENADNGRWPKIEDIEDNPKWKISQNRK